MRNEKLPAETLRLYDGMVECGLTVNQVWLTQVAVGGDAGSFEVEAYVLGLLTPDPYHHDLIAQAINEHFIEQGRNHRVAYSDTTSDQVRRG